MASSTDNLQILKGVVSVRRFTKLPVAWAAETDFATGDYVYMPTSKNLYKATTGGTSAASPGTGPSGTTSSITDGTVTWAYVPWVDVGNVPKFEFTPEVEKDEHFTSRAGIKVRDKTVILSKKGSLAITFEEGTMENMEIALLGTLSGSSPNREIEIFDAAEITCQVKCEGTNDVGPRRSAFFGHVAFQPDSAVPFISDSWAQYDLKGEVNLDGLGSFGKFSEAA
ncbi:hypothetical protein [Methylocystis parvus]|uniref:hypothetical protein n=1 Tax=Methylocystis parvus TaxID=134 RepID=UPI003C77BB52